MPGALRRCAGCNATETQRNLCHVIPGGGDQRRCQRCHRSSSLWQTCEIGWCELRATATQARCVPLRAVAGLPASPARQAAIGKYACPACVFAHICTLHSIMPYRHPLEDTNNPAELLAATHFAILRNEVHLWIMPKRDRCTYYAARVILWRRFGVLVGILPGMKNSNAYNNNAAIARHINRLKNANRWPVSDTKVVLVGVKRTAVPVVQSLSPQQRRRLHGFPKSLTRSSYNLRGMNWDAFNRAPAAADHASVPLVRICAELLRSIDLTTGGRPGNGQARVWHGRTQAEGGFRRSLHTSTAALFRWPAPP